MSLNPKHCPFCGLVPVITTFPRDNTIIECSAARTQCQVAPAVQHKIREEALRIWNYRPFEKQEAT